MTRLLIYPSAEHPQSGRIYLKLDTNVQMGKKKQQMEKEMGGCFGKTFMLCFMGEAYFKKGQKCPHREFQTCKRLRVRLPRAKHGITETSKDLIVLAGRVTDCCKQEQKCNKSLIISSQK